MSCKTRTPEEGIAHALKTVRETRGRRPGGTILLAVGGLTAAGKSFLARRMQAALRETGERAWILEGDRFILPKDRRRPPERYPEDVYEMARLRRAIRTLRDGRAFLAPFYHKTGMATERLSGPAGCFRDTEPARQRRWDYRVRDASALRGRCRGILAHAESRLWIDADTGDLLEETPPGADVWIFDSELALALPDLRGSYDGSYAVWATRARRRRNFLQAVRAGERYPVLTEREALEKIEGFFLEDDRYNRRHLRHARIRIDNSGSPPAGDSPPPG